MPYSHITRTSFGADAIAYARGHGVGHDGTEKRNQLVGAVNMLPDHVISFEKQMQPFWNKADPRHTTQINRCIVSFSTEELDPDDPGDCARALDIGREIARANAPDCQSAVFVQTDGRGHKVHIHILTNDVRMSDCKGVDSKAYSHFHFAPLVDKICARHIKLKQAEPEPERINQTVRGRRMANEKIRAANAQEYARAKKEGRPVDRDRLRDEKYIWQDDLRKRVKNAAEMSLDEETFAHMLSCHGVELVPQMQKDGTLAFRHRATRKQPEHYVYELVDVAGFDGRIPPNLRSKSFKLGTNYQPEGVAKLFGLHPSTKDWPGKTTPPLPSQLAAARAASRVERKPATPGEAVRQYLSRLSRQYLPNANAGFADELFERFAGWSAARRKRKGGGDIPPVYEKGGGGEIVLIQDELGKQYREFLDGRMMRAAEWQRMVYRTQVAVMEQAMRGKAGIADGKRDGGKSDDELLAQAKSMAKKHVAPILWRMAPQAGKDDSDRLFESFTRWRVKAKKDGRDLKPIYRKDGRGGVEIVEDQLEEQYTEFLTRKTQDEAERRRLALKQQIAAMENELERKAGDIAGKAEEEKGEDEHTK